MKFINVRYPTLVSVCFIFSVVLSLSVGALVDEQNQRFVGYDENSALTINYDDMSTLLKLSVFDVGKSFRQKVSEAKAEIGSRLKSTRNIHTALEANRFLFSAFKDPQNRQVLEKIRASLQQVPDEVQLKEFNKNEQLAFWLNLYNITLLDELQKVSSKSKLGNYLYGKNSLLDKKLLKISDVDLSLNDIQHKIIYPKYDFDPLLMYGFYQGVIGGPNIRVSAYTAKNVFGQLADNALEFVNSNRGLFQGRKGTVRVSLFYKRNSDLFPDFENDLKKHLIKYAEDDFYSLVKNAQFIVADIKDMHIANLFGGARGYGRSSATNSAAMIDSTKIDPENTSNVFSNIESSYFHIGLHQGPVYAVKGFSAINPGEFSENLTGAVKSKGNYSSATLEVLAKLKENSQIRQGSVTVSEGDIELDKSLE